MITAAEVLKFLRPNGGWTIYGEDFDSIIYDEGVIPVQRKEFDEAFSLVEDANKKALEAAENKKKAAEAKLLALGLTTDDLKALGLA